jgi:hypothetical protein
MHLELTRPNKYRHVVFTGPTGSTARLVNLAPRSDEHEPVAASVKDHLTEEEHAFIRSVFACAGLNADAYRSESLRRRLHACLRAIRASSVLEARRNLADDLRGVGVKRVPRRRRGRRVVRLVDHEQTPPAHVLEVREQ